MITLSTLKNTHRPRKKIQRVGRGVGSKRGKTCCRGHKGDKARAGYKTHLGREGGQLPLYRKLPCRGFTNDRFKARPFAVNLSTIEKLYQAGEIVNIQTLQEKGLAPRLVPGGIRVLGSGELKKKVTIEALYFSESAREKLEKSGISFKEIPLNKEAKAS